MKQSLKYFTNSYRPKKEKQLLGADQKRANGVQLKKKEEKLLQPGCFNVYERSDWLCGKE